MSKAVPYDDAVDLLDADHKAVKKLFIDYDVLCEEKAPAPQRQALAGRICLALTVHAQIEEEIFYPQVRDALGDDTLVAEALKEHAQAKETIALIQSMDAGASDYDATVQKLGQLIDAHVLEEREQIFLRARNAAVDLRGMTPALYERQKQLTRAALAGAKGPAKKPAKAPSKELA